MWPRECRRWMVLWDHCAGVPLHRAQVTESWSCGQATLARSLSRSGYAWSMMNWWLICRRKVNRVNLHSLYVLTGFKMYGNDIEVCVVIIGRNNTTGYRFEGWWQRLSWCNWPCQEHLRCRNKCSEFISSMQARKHHPVNIRQRPESLIRFHLRESMQCFCKVNFSYVCKLQYNCNLAPINGTFAQPFASYPRSH